MRRCAGLAAGQELGLAERLKDEFEKTMMPHAAAAFRLARWLSKHDSDAADIVQEAWTRAYRYFDSYAGGDPKTWLLSVVRRVAFTQLSARERVAMPLDEEVAAVPMADPSPLERLVATAETRRVHAALAALPLHHREVLVLRELDGLSYKDIADITHQPMGTVMSRLSRAREKLRELLLEEES